MQPRISMVTLAVEDLARALAFYRDGLGFPAEGIREGDDHAALELQPGLSLVLFERAALAQAARQPPAVTRSREVMLGYPAASPEEVRRVLRRAEAAGAAVPRPPETFPWGYCAWFLDPDGHLWELLAPAGGEGAAGTPA